MTTLTQFTGQARIKRLTSPEAKALTVATVSGFAPNMVADHDTLMLSQQAFADFTPALRAPYRWQDWAAPWSDRLDHPRTSEGQPCGWKRRELFAAGDGRLFVFINQSLLPHLRTLDLDPRTAQPNPDASRS
jgi:hypothetical protein